MILTYWSRAGHPAYHVDRRLLAYPHWAARASGDNASRRCEDVPTRFLRSPHFYLYFVLEADDHQYVVRGARFSYHERSCDEEFQVSSGRIRALKCAV